jgi:hypothetical protein
MALPRHASPPSTPWRTFEPPAQSPSVSFGGTLGALAVAVGFGVLVAHMLDLHGHRCERCGRRWRHFGAFNLGDEKSHTCASCGEVQWWKCGAPHVLRGSQFAQLPTVPSTLGPEMPPFAVPALAGPGASVMPAAFPTMFPAPPPALAIQGRRRSW